MNTLLEKIKSKGYWKVIISPTVFQEDRIPSKEECAKLIQESQIRLRGWYYPHIHHNSITPTGNDNVGSECEGNGFGKYELWRFYQNGLFVHYFSMDEDYELEPKKIMSIRRALHMKESDNLGNKFLSILSTLYEVTEIFLFAANLAKNGKPGKEIYIEIELADVKGRTLFFWDSFDRVLFGAYTCRFDSGNIIT